MRTMTGCSFLYKPKSVNCPTLQEWRHDSRETKEQSRHVYRLAARDANASLEELALRWNCKMWIIICSYTYIQGSWHSSWIQISACLKPQVTICYKALRRSTCYVSYKHFFKTCTTTNTKLVYSLQNNKNFPHCPWSRRWVNCN